MKMSLAVASVGLLAAATALIPQEALAQGHGRGGPRGGHGPAPRPVIVGGGFYGYPAPYFGFGLGWGYGFGFAPFYGPAAFGLEGGVDPSAAMVAGMGAIDFNIKPGQAEVWVDGKFVAEARDLDGYPSFLWLPEGPHQVVVYKGGYRRFDETIDVRRGMTTAIKIKMEKGESEPPGQRPESQDQQQKNKKKKDDKDKAEQSAFIY
jgi:hypothetical protein